MSSHMTIQSFAMEIQMSVDDLIKQFLDVGIIKTKFDFVTQSEKDILLRYMNGKNNIVFDKFFLQRKTHSILNVSSIGGKSKKIQVEVRKKRVYMVKSSAKKNDICHNVSNELDNNNIFENKTELLGGISANIPEKNQNNDHFNDKNNVDLLNKTDSCDKSSSSSIVNKIKNRLDMQDFNKDNAISQKIYYTKPDLTNPKNVISKWDTKSVNNIHQSKINNINDIDRISVLKVKNDNFRLEHEHRHNNVRTRLKYKVTGKIVKQKRNSSNRRSCIEVMHEEFYSEEKLCSMNRVNKNKRKHSTLVQSFNKPIQTVPRNIVIGDTISVLELSNKMSIKSSHMIKIMMKLGLIVTINQVLDQETAQLVVEEMGHHVVLRRKNELESLIMDENFRCDTNVSMSSNNYICKPRPPIVTMMGHVDHGKTSLLDCIRAINTVNTEFRGITQSIKSYRVQTKNGNLITFLDTPGHEAFCKMRIRGAQLTDIVILVVAADDGVMPQTVESIQHIKSANIPVVVAINKIDKSEANVESIKHALNKYGLVPEEWGGNTQFVKVSARLGCGIDDLLDAILLQAEILELKTVYNGMAKAVVIESALDKGRGPIVTVLVQEGVLKCGDIILCGTEYGRVKAIRDEFGSAVVTAEPSVPVEILGLSGVPNSGETMVVVGSEKKAREVALYRQVHCREIRLARKQEERSSKNIFNNINDPVKTLELNFIIKSDTQGSAEAICESLEKLSTNKIIIKILFAAIGDITETDCILALTSNTVILAFNVRVDFTARRIIELNKIEVYYYSVIYDLLDKVNNIINRLLVPRHAYKVIGIATVHNVFRSPKCGIIAGCMVTEGIVKLHKKVKIIRNNIMVYEGELESLRHFKSDVNEVKVGVECGIIIKNCCDICVGDIIKVLDKSDSFCC